MENNREVPEAVVLMNMGDGEFSLETESEEISRIMVNGSDDDWLLIYEGTIYGCGQFILEVTRKNTLVIMDCIDALRKKNEILEQKANELQETV